MTIINESIEPLQGQSRMLKNLGYLSSSTSLEMALKARLKRLAALEYMFPRMDLSDDVCQRS